MRLADKWAVALRHSSPTLRPAGRQKGQGLAKGTGDLRWNKDSPSQDTRNRKQTQCPKSTQIWTLHTSTAKIYSAERKINFETERPIGLIKVLCESYFYHFQNNHKPPKEGSYSICFKYRKSMLYKRTISTHWSNNIKYIQKSLKLKFSLW